jgi:proteasome assembly chaperone (PAC2) family protein
MGAVALLAINYLRQELDAHLFAEIEPYGLFSPSQVDIRDGLIQELEFPETRFYYWDEAQVHDLIILVGKEQPPDAHAMASRVLDLAQHFGVERVYTAAAFPMLMHHTQSPGVWGTCTHAPLLRDLEAFDVRLMDQGTIGGLNGVLLSVAKERGIEGLCLLGEIPIYATQMINPMASHAILTVLARMLGIRVNLDKLVAWADDLRAEMDKLYELLPEHVKEATLRGADLPTSAGPERPTAEAPLVADDEFFKEIEQFLEQSSSTPDSGDQRPPPGDREDEDEQDPDASPP